MTYNDMLRIAMEQSAEDLGCKADDFNPIASVCLLADTGNCSRRINRRVVNFAFCIFSIICWTSVGQNII